MLANIRIFVPALCVLLLMLASGCSEEPRQEQPEVIRPVVTYTVPEVLQTRQWTTSGTAKNSLSTALSFRIGGAVIELPAKLGLDVARGQTLAVLDPSDAMLELRAAEAGLNDLMAELNNAEANYQRIKELAERDVVSESNYDQALAEFESTKAKVAKQQDQVELSRRNLSYTKLTAPQAGTINSVDIDVHRNVSPGETVLTLSSGDRLDIELGVPDKLVPYIKVGDKVQATFDVYNQITLPGTITEVGVAAEDSPIYPVTVSLDESDKRLRSGMIAQVVFEFNQVAQMRLVSVPSAAVFGEAGGKRYVWIVSPDNETVSKREIEVGLPGEEGLVIHGGLNAGDIVVVRGVHRLQDGQQVKLMQ